jgi:SAM-dependent methyltransferase
MLDAIYVAPPLVRASGWALTPVPERARFLVDGRTPDQVEFPEPSMDLDEVFWALPEARRARFSLCDSRVTFDDDRFVTLEFQPFGTQTEESAASRWYVRDPRIEPPAPAGEQISRVVNDCDQSKFSIGGASVFCRFNNVLMQYGAPAGFRSYERILDWGCGAGRLTRYLLAEAEEWQEVWGAEVDPVNLNWCSAALPSGRFELMPLHPPTHLPDSYFDLIIGVSVFTHLREPVAEEWLKELKRIARPGAMLLVTVQGSAVMALAGAPGSIARNVRRNGILVTGDNTQLRIADDSEAYYVDVFHSVEYIRARWSKHFNVLGVLPGVGLHQDLVVLRNEKAAGPVCQHR